VSEPDRILRRGPFLAVLLQGLPLAIGLASHALINLVDLLIIGRLGDDAVQSAHIGSTWNFLPMIVGQCVSTALLAQLSRRLGEGKQRSARAFNVRAQWFMVWLGLFVSVLTALPAVWQVEGTGVVGQVRDDAVHYLVVSNLGCLSMFVMMQTTAAMRAAGEAWMPLALLLGANVLNLGLDIVLLFGWPEFQIPAVGVVGAAYASVASRTLASLVAVWWLRRRSHVLSLRAARESIADPVAMPLLKDSWPQAIQIGLRASIVIALTVLVQRQFGDEATVSLGITTRLDTLVLFSSLGFANAATAYAGRAVAAGQVRDARMAGLWAALQAMAFGAVFVCIYGQHSETLVGWFLPDPSARVLELTQLYFGTAAWAQVLAAGALAAIGASYGAGSMIAPMLIDLVAFAIAAVILWGAVSQAGGLASWYQALLLGMAAVLLLQLVLVVRGGWARADMPG
tara:strand:+ start:9137 stop:10501 length:1365 start_codon:yes stop_codon:yes gene_type:complete